MNGVTEADVPKEGIGVEPRAKREYHPWSVRLKALLPTWLPWARERLTLSDETEGQLRAISPRQIDRALAPDKRRHRRRLYGGTRPGILLRHHIPIKTAHWDVTEPEFTEVNLVNHSGDRADGECLHSLDVTDIHTTRVERRVVLRKCQVACRKRLSGSGSSRRSPSAGSIRTMARSSSTPACTATASARAFSSPRAALQEGRQRAYRAEKSDARAQAHGVSAL